MLDHGEIVERGTHDELLARGGAYAALLAHDAQPRRTTTLMPWHRSKPRCSSSSGEASTTTPSPARSRPKAILLNPGNHELFGWDELWGIPVLADERVAPKRFRIDCDGSAFGIEAELAQAIAAPEPLIVPVGPGTGREGEPTA